MIGMKTLLYHINGLKITIEQFAKGRYLLYFVPAIVLTLVYWYFQYYLSSMNEKADTVTSIPWIGEYAGYVVDFTFGFFDIILNQVYIFVILTCLSPVNTYLSEKLDNGLTGFEVKFDLLRFVNDFFRMVFVVILAIFLELTFMGVYWVVSWIFGLGIIDPIVYFVLAAFFFGFSFYDYSLERYGVGVFGTLGYAFKNPLTMLLTGSIFLAIYAIPYAGIPIAPGIAVMVATIVYLYKEKKYPVPAGQKTIETNE